MSASKPTAAVGVIANRFEINDLKKDLLGRGGMGDVYRATDTETGQTVAIKALKPDVVANAPDIVARFMREGEALRQLNHPNIVKMVAAIEEAGQHYLVMEYVKGGSLQDLLDAEGALPVARVLEISLEVADALTRAHHLDIIHRDLKPANVLLAEDGTPRLTDFGIAHLADSSRLTQAGMLVGTIGYLSPEACQGEPLDRRADIWAFGVMLYEMLTGELPFTGETLIAALNAILTQSVPDLAQRCPNAPDALVDLVYRMLEKDRYQRIPSVRLVGAELEAVLREGARGRPLSTADRFATHTPLTEAPRHNLPIQPTPFVGREAELIELARLLTAPDVHLLTILGAGGMGKTRLALEAGENHIDDFEHGVYFVSLAPLQSVDAIVPTVAEALGFSFYTDAEDGATAEPRQELLDYLRRKRMLILMDNYEHLLDGVDLVTDILQTAPDVKILTTSRTRLSVQGEHLFHLAGMNFPDWETPEDATEYGAVKLFLQSARRVRPGFELEPDDMKYISRICRLVEGMPLGILLAAAWVEMLTPAEIATQISGEISQSLDFLESDLRDVPTRQRSIRAVFDYSWNLLTEREREVFQALSVFRGGFTREAAQRVTFASLRELMMLVNKSLLRRTPTGRYQVHELLRQYAADKLHRADNRDRSPVASETVRDRHCAYYTGALQRWYEDVKGSRQRMALAEMDMESENARAAWDWAVEQGQVERLDQALEGLCWFYRWRLRLQEGEAACQSASRMIEARAAPKSGNELRVWAKILAWQSELTRDTELASQLIQRSLVLLERPELAGQDTRSEKAFILMLMGHRRYSSDRKDARQLYRQSLALYQALGDRWGMATILSFLGWVARNLGEYDEARRLFEESLAIGQALGNQWRVTSSLVGLGIIAIHQGQLEGAERSIREYIAIVQEGGARHQTAVGLRDLGWTYVMLGKYSEAHAVLEESIAIQDDLGRQYSLVVSSAYLSFTEAQLGQYEQARSHGQTSLTLAQESGNRREVGTALLVLGHVALAEGAYAEAQGLLQESIAVYREIGQREILGVALAVLGVTACKLGDLRQARLYLSEALRTGTEIGAFMPLVYTLPAVTLFLAGQGEHEQAVELYALASRFPLVTNSRWFEDVVGRHIAAVAATLPPDVVTAAQERGQARDLEATAAELLAEL